MRKSGAPSRKFISPVVETIQPVSVNENLQGNQTLSNNDPTIRKTCHILNILRKSTSKTTVKSENHTKTQPASSEILENVSPNTPLRQARSDNKFYNVVWGKKSTKKHKTWEGDGILEVGEKSAILKDSEGTEMCRATNIKTELIEDGYILSIGSKEVQILDLIPHGSPVVSMKRSATDKPDSSCQKSIKKAKNQSATPLLLNLKPVIQRKRIFSTNFQSLILPQPSSEHQWSFNTNKKPVTQVSVDPCLAQVLRPHQRTGVVFLYECVQGYKQDNYFGAILADEMGLGKTLQCITLIWTLLKQGPYGEIPVIKRALVVTPSSLTGNWEKEFLSWLGRERIRVFLADSKNKPKDYIKTSHIPILIISYEMFVRYFEELNSITFDLLICDEGHRLKNNSIKAATLLSQLNCQKRIILTGTPIQNDLKEFYSLANFVNPGCLGSNPEYHKYYEEPIVASREPDADDEVKLLGEEKARELNQKTKHFILRRTQDLLDKYLPTKTETVIFCKSSALQRKLYSAAVDFWENRDVSNKEIVHLNVITALKKICNHPSLLRKHSADDDNESLANHLIALLPNWDEMSPHDSGKLKVLLELLSNLSELKEKLVIVSCYTQTLDMVADVLRHHGYLFARLDGSVPSNQRTKLVDNFNNKFSKDFVFLLSSKAGGVGLNLVGASRLVLFDSDWNPATDLQAMSRVWRDGQKKSVFLYRFLTTGTIEEKIYQRQISKTGLSGTVVDPSNTKSIRMYDEELKDLFSPEFDSECSTHFLLNCECLGDGVVPEPPQSSMQDFEDRKCQLGVEKSSENSQNLKMNHLMQWEHYQQPFDVQILKELGFIDVGNEISYIFRSKCSL